MEERKELSDKELEQVAGGSKIESAIIQCSHCGHPVEIELRIENKYYTRCPNCSNRTVYVR